MKAAVLFAFASTAAAAAVGCPARGSSSSTVQTTKATATAAATATATATTTAAPEKPAAGQPKKQLLPFLPPGQFADACGSSQYTDADCGTEKYCKAFDSLKNRTDGKFGSSKACFEAHVQPWKEPGQYAEACGTGAMYTDDTCGTDKYCRAFDSLQSRTDGKFGSSKACFEAHAPNPKPKLPWKEPGQFADACGTGAPYTDDACGTDMYCKAFDSIKNRTDGKFGSSKACFEAHDPKPKA